MARPMSVPGANWRRRTMRFGKKPGVAIGSAMTAAPPSPKPLPQEEAGR